MSARSKVTRARRTCSSTSRSSIRSRPMRPSTTRRPAGSADSGTDFEAAAGSVTIPKGKSDAIVNVPIDGDIDPEQDETLTLTISNPQPDTPIARATATGTILDDDNTRNFTVIGETGHGVDGVEPYLGINNKGDVAFVGDKSGGGGQGLYVGNGQATPVNINPTFTASPRRFENVSLADDGQVVANDIFPGSPASWFIRSWTNAGRGRCSRTRTTTVRPTSRPSTAGRATISLSRRYRMRAAPTSAPATAASPRPTSSHRIRSTTTRVTSSTAVPSATRTTSTTSRNRRSSSMRTTSPARGPRSRATPAARTPATTT